MFKIDPDNCCVKLLNLHFANELSMVNNNGLKNFVYHAFQEVVSPNFFVKPASSTGKNHPRRSNEENGLVRHTKYAIWWYNQLCEMQEGHSLTHSHGVAALLLHDVHKHEPNHGAFTAGALSSLVKYVENPDISLVIVGVATHMGKWGTPRPTDVAGPMKGFCNLIHLADYCASRHFDRIDEFITMV